MGVVYNTHLGRRSRGVYRDFVEKPEGKRPLGGPSYRWKDNVKMEFQEWNVVVWTGLIWLRKRRGGRQL
jgi:hypothetical protein